MHGTVRTLPAFVAAITLMSLSALPACKGDSGDAGAAAGKDAGKASDAKTDGKSDVNAGPSEAGQPNAEAGTDKPAEPTAEGGALPSATTSVAAAESGAPPADTTGEPAVDPIPGLLELAKNLDTDDAAASKALNDAVTAGAAKLDVAKIANERGEALLTKGESERAEPFFVWARDAHNLFAEPVYNLAKLAAYAGDLEIAKEHLQELQKRGNKKLMKKVGVDPAFAPLQDDPDVRQIFEQ